MNTQVLKNLFIPNAVVPRSALRKLALFQGLFIIAVWYLFAPATYPTPEGIAKAFLKLVDQDELLYNLAITVLWNGLALLLTGVVSLLLAYSTVIKFMETLVNGMSRIRFMGLVGWLYFMYQIAPSDVVAKVYLVLFGIVGYMVSSMTSVVASVTKDEKDYCRSLRMPEWRVVWESTVLGKFDRMLDVFRDNAAMGLLVLTMLEMSFRSQGGIGVVLSNQNKKLDMDGIFAIQGAIFIAGFLQDLLISLIKRLSTPYAFIKLEGGK